MKKTYETPCADKIAFNYRDQVVAASGDDISGGGGTGFPTITIISGTPTCQILNAVVFGYDLSFCSRNA